MASIIDDFRRGAREWFSDKELPLALLVVGAPLGILVETINNIQEGVNAENMTRLNERLRGEDRAKSLAEQKAKLAEAAKLKENPIYGGADAFASMDEDVAEAARRPAIGGHTLNGMVPNPR